MINSDSNKNNSLPASPIKSGGQAENQEKRGLGFGTAPVFLAGINRVPVPASVEKSSAHYYQILRFRQLLPFELEGYLS